MSYRRTTDFEEADYMSQPSRGRGGGDQVRVMEREHDVYMADQHRDRTPAFLREGGRRAEPGPMVLRRREVESFDRHRSPSPPPRRILEERIVRRARSESPPARERSRTRIVETERTVSPVRRRSSPSPTVRFVERVVRERSPTPPSSEIDHERIRIVERERGRSPERSPSPSPPPPVIKAPTIEREVITHYTDIDHGVIRAPQPSPPPPPPPRRQRDDFRETDIDIHLDKHRTDVDIRRRSRSRSRHRGYHDDDLGIYDSDSDSDYRNRLRVDVAPRRARSMMGRSSEGERIASRIDARGRMGEARGAERVRMDGAGGARTDTTWTRYSGERRTKFLPDGSAAVGAVPAPILKNAPREGTKARERRLSVAVVDRDTEIDIEQRRRRRRSRSRPGVVAPRDTWTEVSRSLVSREAMDRLGYPYQESKHYYYIMMFLPSDAVSELMNLSEDIRRARRRKTNDRSREIELDIEIDRDHHHRPVQRRRRRSSGHLDEHFRELEVSIDGRRPRGGYYY
ncbi:hypothetical protein ISF_08404 [Cordyceps fumosorosea ARSEF 2679]|uniref:DUF8035 domain-containing protein n=1 Tax=Cordyceps fumosorosea (strain ARSEF 2679) TaxID=1081104 RepID=A0A162J827_CORFA|nr:hypothetical protein ISF_08404 [Cordyceps fumosorosea ARSEF 2679]OAA54177.1 hypothetical protein ISF_08404 [Cordyceps fumosorosea ARSEF 2679]